jgi:hypothetical protein
MSNNYFSLIGSTPGNVSLVALTVNNCRYRVVKGYIQSLSVTYPRPVIIESTSSVCPSHYYPCPSYTTLDISMSIPTGGLVVDAYDPLQPYPIGSKIVDECSVDELLFAVQHKLGILVHPVKS